MTQADGQLDMETSELPSPETHRVRETPALLPIWRSSGVSDMASSTDGKASRKFLKGSGQRKDCGQGSSATRGSGEVTGVGKETIHPFNTK